MAHFLPVDNGSAPELLHVNGEALIEPFPMGVDQMRIASNNQQYNTNPRHVTPRHVRTAVKLTTPPMGAGVITALDTCDLL
ncbi:hypothetical protein P43SY_010645 [Pythium insidiosum]|uniref:Uncharacterized protein n=1 Tax=Pythium insidiosum TaxID=114742 RepID=A0AAD5Q069_PYTIN|nr:hypothetical protein P43SY_010645 [Pythium insidiosum]